MNEAGSLPWLEAPLLAALSYARRHHALLIHGPQGVGQFELALALAQAWLCEAASADRPACGACASCKLFASHNHPDLVVLLPETLREKLGWIVDDGESAVESNRSGRKPSKEIKVEAVRQAVSFSQTSCARGRAKVVVIHPADRLNAIAANTLLKTLEEPPGMARFILVTGDAGALLPTVRSRCQALLVPVPDSDVAVAWLVQQGVAAPQVMLAAAGGRPLEAVAWAEDGVDARAWADLPAQVARGEAGGLAAWPVPRALEALLKLCHDALLRHAGVAPRFFSHVPVARDAMTLHAWAKALRDAARYAEHPLNPGLLVESLVLQGSRAFVREK